MADNKKMKRLNKFTRISHYRFMPWLIFGVALLGIHLIMFFPGFRGSEFSPENASNFGEFIGGYIGTIISVVTLLFVWKTYLESEHQNKQKSFEDNFFQYLNLFENTMAENELSNKKGKNVFSIILNDLKINLSLIAKASNEIKLSISDNDKLLLAFTILLYGPMFHEENILPKMTERILGNKLKIFEERLLLAIHDHKLELSDSEINLNYVPWNSKQTILSIFFRQLFHLFEFIDNTDCLDQNTKYMYGKIIRSCLTTQQQAVLALDIVTGFGQGWVANGYLDRYCPIKNIPENYLRDYINKSMGELFPNVDFEYKKTHPRIEDADAL